MTPVTITLGMIIYFSRLSDEKKEMSQIGAMNSYLGFNAVRWTKNIRSEHFINSIIFLVDLIKLFLIKLIN